MLILGIDPGIARVGWGFVDETKNQLRAIDYGCHETEKTLSIESRLQSIYIFFSELFATHHPDVAAIEELFFATNVRTAFAVGQARGVILLAAANANLPVVSYTPLQVKLAITGYGQAEKKQVQQMVKAILHLDEIPKPDDTADALALAICHAFSYKLRGKALRSVS